SPKDFANDATMETLDLCLSCKACKTECPSSVDMAKIKTEFLGHYYDRHGVPLRARLMGHIHTLSKLSAPVAPLANLMMSTPLAKPVMSMIGIQPERKLPSFQRHTFMHHWKAWRQQNPVPNVTRGKV